MTPHTAIYLPTAFIPSIGYMRLLALSPSTIIYTGESYRKQSYRNRTDLMTANGRTALSIPVERYPYPPPPTSTILISEHDHWRERHLRTIVSGYGSSPFLEHYIDRIEELLAYPGRQESLVAYNHRWLLFLCEEIGLPCPTVSDQLPDGAAFHTEMCDRHHTPASEAFRRYWQVYEERFGFEHNLSALDLLLNTGPEALLFLTY